MFKGFILSLTFAVIFTILIITTYHWFFQNTAMLVLLLAIESLSFTLNIVLLYSLIHLPKWELSALRMW